MIDRLRRSIRTRLESITREWLFRRKLPKEFGSVRIIVSPCAGLKYLFKSMNEVDKPLLSIANQFIKGGDVVWDIGANIGIFSFAAASKSGPTGKVIAFEPDAWLVQVLRRSAREIPDTCAEVAVVPVAVARELRIAEFCLAMQSRARSALFGYGYDKGDRLTERQTVMVVNIDWLTDFFPAPDVLKIDVEGAEMEVLEGATRLLDSKRPIVVCEVGQQNQQKITKFLQARGYMLYDCEELPEHRTLRDKAPWNTLALPKSMENRT